MTAPISGAIVPPAQANSDADATVQSAAWHIIPLLAVGYIVSYIDRANISFAALTMNRDLGLSATQFGFLAGTFYVGYCLFEVPSNLALQRFGAKRWLARIMFTWGLAAAGTSFAQGYFPTRVPKVSQDCYQTPLVVGFWAILKLPKRTPVWTNDFGGSIPTSLEAYQQQPLGCVAKPPQTRYRRVGAAVHPVSGIFARMSLRALVWRRKCELCETLGTLVEV